MTETSIAAAARNRLAQTALRVAISGYLLFTCLVSESGLQALTARVLPDPAAQSFAVLITAALVLLILSGRGLRTAAVVLALLLFWSGQIAMAELGVTEALGPIWRDFALVGGLMLFAPPRSRTPRPAGIVGRIIRTGPTPDAGDDVVNIFAPRS